MIVHLIGAGESARDLEPATLAGWTIGINEAGRLKRCDMWFSLDHNYARDVLADGALIAAYGAEMVHVCVRHRHMHMFTRHRVNLWRRHFSAEPCFRGDRALSDGGRQGAGCSGFTAINLAFRLGAAEVYLHGYDFHDDYRYFYQAAPFPRLEIANVRRMFRDVAEHYRRHGLPVFNCNPTSSIKGFDYAEPPRVHHLEPASRRA